MEYNILIKKIRKEKKLTLREVAKKTGFSHSYLSQLENNKTSHKDDIRVPIETLKQICEGINYPFRQFLEEAGYIEKVEAPLKTDFIIKCETIEQLGLEKKVLGYIGELLKEVNSDRDAK